MTKQRNDNHSTEFGLWLREQPAIDSTLGYRATNIDFMWMNCNSGKWMLIEEKRHGSKIRPWQKLMFRILHRLCMSDKKFMGFHLITFENTSPEDGKIFLDNKEISKDYLIRFLMFDI